MLYPPHIAIVARQRGIADGMARGAALGKCMGLRMAARAILRRCYGLEGQALVPAVEAIEDPPRLEAIVKAMCRDATLDELKALIEGP